jgi:hypothetical protein
MHEVKFEVQGITDLMFGKPVTSQKKDNETHEQFEERTWKEKISVTKEGQVMLNPFCVTNSLVNAGEWLKRKVPGEQRATFTKRFRCGVSPGEQVLLYLSNSKPAEVGDLKSQKLHDPAGPCRVTIDDIDPVRIFVPSTGERGGSKRVFRIFPTLHDWIAKGNCYIFDGKIDRDVFFDHLVCVGRFVGWGSMRVGNGGINGRFAVTKCEFHEIPS